MSNNSFDKSGKNNFQTETTYTEKCIFEGELSKASLSNTSESYYSVLSNKKMTPNRRNSQYNNSLPHVDTPIPSFMQSRSSSIKKPLRTKNTLRLQSLKLNNSKDKKLPAPSIPKPAILDRTNEHMLKLEKSLTPRSAVKSAKKIQKDYEILKSSNLTDSIPALFKSHYDSAKITKTKISFFDRIGSIKSLIFGGAKDSESKIETKNISGVGDFLNMVEERAENEKQAKVLFDFLKDRIDKFDLMLKVVLGLCLNVSECYKKIDEGSDLSILNIESVLSDLPIYDNVPAGLLMKVIEFGQSCSNLLSSDKSFRFFNLTELPFLMNKKKPSRENAYYSDEPSPAETQPSTSELTVELPLRRADGDLEDYEAEEEIEEIKPAKRAAYKRAAKAVSAEKQPKKVQKKEEKVQKEKKQKKQKEKEKEKEKPTKENKAQAVRRSGRKRGNPDYLKEE